MDFNKTQRGKATHTPFWNREDGADGVIFSCTEVGLLVSASDFDMPVFDSTALHAKAAIDFALGS